MATYVALVSWTDQGVKNVKDTVQRARQFRSDVERRGGKVTSMYWTQGQYDIVATMDVPDEQTAMSILFALGGAGNVRTQTLRAFTETDVESILQKM